MKLLDAINIYNVFSNILEEDKENTINGLSKYKMLTNIKTLTSYMENFETVRKGLIEKYGTKDEENGYHIDPEDTETIEKVKSELEAIYNSEVNVELSKFKMDDVLKWNLPASVLVAIYEVIESE